MQSLQSPGHVFGVESDFKDIGRAAAEAPAVLAPDAFKIVVVAEDFFDLIAAPAPRKDPRGYPAGLKEGGDDYRFGDFSYHIETA